MRERYDVVAVGTLHCRDDPFRGALLDRMDRIAGGRLEYLGQHAVRVTRKNVAQCAGLCFGRIKLCDAQAHEGPPDLDGDAGIGWQISLADDSADGAFTADQMVSTSRPSSLGTM